MSNLSMSQSFSWSFNLILGWKL